MSKPVYSFNRYAKKDLSQIFVEGREISVLKAYLNKNPEGLHQTIRSWGGNWGACSIMAETSNLRKDIRKLSLTSATDEQRKAFFKCALEFFEAQPARLISSNAGSTSCCGITAFKLNGDKFPAVKGGVYVPTKGDKERVGLKQVQHKMANGRICVLRGVEVPFWRPFLVDECEMFETRLGDCSVFFYEKTKKGQIREQPGTYNFGAVKPSKPSSEKFPATPRPVNLSQFDGTSEDFKLFYGFSNNSGEVIHRINQDKVRSHSVEIIILRDKEEYRQIEQNYLAARDAGFITLTRDGQPFRNAVYPGVKDFRDIHWLLPMARRNPFYEEDR